MEGMTKAVERHDSKTPAHGVSFAEATWTWARVALLSFGGPAAQIAVMHRIIVDEKRWVSESRFLYALNYCMLLPGPEAKQLAVYIGWLMHRTWGGIVAGSLFVLPGAELPEQARPTGRRALAVSAIWLALWLVPVIAILLTLGIDNVFSEIALFFSKMAVVTFGGAYAVLAYVAQGAVEQYHWLQAGEMLDGLGMAETTPGPLIMVLQFVGFMAAYRDPGNLSPLTAATLGGLLTTWVTFVPCFLWIFLGAPFVEVLRGNKALNGAMSAITAAVVGVVLNLATWFAIHSL